MPGAYLVSGQRIANQHERNVTVGLNAIGSPGVEGGRLKITSIPIGPTALASIGTNTTDIAGQWWITDIWVPVRRKITTIGVLQGGTATTDKIMAAIFDTFGNLVCSTPVAGTTLSGANTFLELSIALDNTGATITSQQLYGPQQYFIGVQGNGTAAGAIQTVKTATYIDVITTVVSGTFGTVPASITVPTTFTADKGPVVYVY